MEVFLNFIDGLFKYTIYMSLMGGIIVIAISFFKFVIRNKLGTKFQYALWFILMLRLILPITPQSKISIYNYIPTINNGAYTISYNDISKNIINADTTLKPVNDYNKSDITEAARPVLNQTNNNNYVNKSIPDEHSIKKINLNQHILPILWSSVFLLALMVISILNTRFIRQIKKSPIIYDENILEMLRECKEIIGVKCNVTLIKTNAVNTPAIFGCIRPRILIPSNIMEKSNLIHMRYILLHELAHIKRKDIFINYLTVLLSLVHWFNPLIWYGFHRMREEREQCCDALVLFSLHDLETTNYGTAIIQLSEISSKAPWLPGMAAIINNKSKTKRRIIMIRDFKKKSYRLSAFAVALLFVFSCIMLTSANAKLRNENQAMKAKSSTNNYEPQQLVFDKIEYPFVDDKQLVGKWEVVDLVHEINDFSPDSVHLSEEPFLISMTIFKNGKMAAPVIDGEKTDENTAVEWLKWTKGYILDSRATTASQYTIKEIDGSQYMFMEWKAGDYIIKGLTPSYYVLRKYDPSNPKPIPKPLTAIEDKIDYPFENDKKLLGKWKTVDYVYEIDNFNPEKIGRFKDLYVKGMTIMDDGSIAESLYGEIKGSENTVSYVVTWTRGYIINHINKTASHYTIKKINGSEYLFMEWKSGDYTIRGWKPPYFVMKKVD